MPMCSPDFVLDYHFAVVQAPVSFFLLVVYIQARFCLHMYVHTTQVYGHTLSVVVTSSYNFPVLALVRYDIFLSFTAHHLSAK